MAAASMRRQKRSSLRRIAAKNFLSNISLDGSHTDTKYGFNVWKNKKHKHDNESHEGLKAVPDLTGAESANVQQKKQAQNSADTNMSFGKENVNDCAESRPRAKTMFQPKHSQSCEVFVEKDKTPSKRWRTSSIDRTNTRRRLIQLPMESVPIIRENVEKTDRTSRRSSSLSGDSNDSHDHEVRFLSPDSRRKIKNERILIVSNKKAPLVISSVLPYNKQAQAIRLEHHLEDYNPNRSRHHSGTRSISSQEDMFLLGQKVMRGDDGQDVSYSELLEPSKKRHELKRAVSESRLPISDSGNSHIYARSISDDPRNYLLAARASIATSVLERVVEEEEEITYDPNLLDDPELQSGGYRTVLNFSSYLTSVIDYVKPSTLKKELNEKFKERFPNIQLTLTKFRSLKREIKIIGHVKCNVDLWVIAQAYVFYEKLILKLLITKQNRKLCAGACLMLSAKLNDLKGPELSKLIDEIEDDLRLHRKEMLSYEFATLVALEFSLHITDNDIYPHYQRLLYQS